MSGLQHRKATAALTALETARRSGYGTALAPQHYGWGIIRVDGRQLRGGSPGKPNCPGCRRSR